MHVSIVCSQPHERVHEPLAPECIQVPTTHECAEMQDGHLLGSVWARDVRCTIQDQGADLLARSNGEFNDRACSLRHAQKCDMIQPQLLAQRCEVGGILMCCRDAAGESVTSAIEANQSKAVTEGSYLWIPHVQVEGPAMHQEQDRS